MWWPEPEPVKIGPAPQHWGGGYHFKSKYRPYPYHQASSGPLYSSLHRSTWHICKASQGEPPPPPSSLTLLEFFKFSASSSFTLGAGWNNHLYEAPRPRLQLMSVRNLYYWQPPLSGLRFILVILNESGSKSLFWSVQIMDPDKKKKNGTEKLN